MIKPGLQFRAERVNSLIYLPSPTKPTMSLIKTLTGDMKTAMKARDSERLGTIRMLISGLKNQQIKDQKELSEEDEISFLATEAKRRQESIDSYVEANREDLAEVERKDLAVIQEYLPKPLSEDEVKEIIATIKADTGAESKRDMGKIMGRLMGEIRGRFDGKAAKDLVLQALD